MRRLCAALALVLAAAGVSFRVAQVNREAQVPPFEYYGVGKWVVPGDSTLTTTPMDMSEYAVRVNGVRAMSPNGYLREYGTDGVTSVDSVDADRVSVVVLDMTIENRSTELGGIEPFMWRVVPPSGNIDYPFDSELYAHAEPRAAMGVFSVAPGGSFRTSMPFSGKVDQAYFSPSGSWERPRAEEGGYRLCLTSFPVRKTVLFDLEVPTGPR